MTETQSSELALIQQGGAAQSSGPLAFRFGDAESVLDRRELSEYFEVWHNGRWFEPPLPMGRLAQVFNLSAYHRSAVALKVNMLTSQMVASRWLGQEDFERFALDFVQMGNTYLEAVPNLAGNVAAAKHCPAVHMRPGIEEGVFWFVNAAKGQEHRFEPRRVFHLMQPDVAQEIYGLPEWISALQSGLLSENATLFRRRYYLNGAHAGFLFYMGGSLADSQTADSIAERLASAKGVGNFKNMFLHIPGGKKDDVQIMPIADVTAKDEFAAIKDISRDDMLASHRVPPQLLGIIPKNTGGFGKVSEARDAFFETEIVPMQRRMLRANDWFGLPLVAFRDYVCADGTVIAQDGTKTVAGAAGARRP